MIPDFTDLGLLPEGIHTATWREVEMRLGFNPHRIALIASAQAFVEEQLHDLDGQLFLGGSMVSSKEIPDDLDLGLGLKVSEKVKRIKAFALHATKLELKKRYNIDFNVSSQLGEDFSHFFQKLKPIDVQKLGVSPTFKRGIIEVTPWKLG
jgi:hypothetical protein